jgi:hypothetical protein
MGKIKQAVERVGMEGIGENGRNDDKKVRIEKGKTWKLR